MSGSQVAHQVDPNFMLSLARGIEVLRAFEGQPSLTVADASRATGLSRQSAGRCLHTLVQLGYVREIHGRFSLTARLLPLACGFITSTPLVSASQAVVNGLRDRIGQTCSVATIDPADLDRIIYIARAEQNQIIAAPLMVGSTLPSHCTSMGRVLLAAMPDTARECWLKRAGLGARTKRTITNAEVLAAELRQVAEQRFSLVEEELSPELRALSVPVHDRAGNIIAALNIATFSTVESREAMLQAYLPELRAAASQLERAI
jgi:IclR family transcriptional regulator, pca regulon regulatory protein